ncbi:MAG: VWA domain-containing protein [Planctomycetes bacterium]|nr:VWA domain-containing protein [Planctomycetota bacterium]
MEDFLRWLAAWKGVEPEPGTELQFEFTAFPTGGLGMLVLLGCLLAVLAIGWMYRRDGRNLTTPQRVVLALLRAAAVIAAIVLLLEPNLVTVKRETRPGHTILLIDSSQSMTHVDAFRRDEVQKLAQGWRAVGVADPVGQPRIELVKALLAHDDGALVRELGRRNVPQLYAFAGSIENLPLQAPPTPPAGTEADPAAPPPLPRLDLTQLGADGRFTNLGGSLRTALDKSRSSEIAAVVIVSDGRRNAGPQGAEVARLLAQRKIPHTFVLGVGDPSETQTVELSRFEAPEKVFQKDEFQMSANVSSQGYDPTTVTVRLLRSGETGGESEVASQQVEIGGDRTEVPVEWRGLTSDTSGRFVYRAVVEPPDGEPPAAERHSKLAMVEVLEERARVLLIAGASVFEYQMLRNTLIRDKTIDVSCWVQNADPKFPQDGNEAVRIDQLPEERQQFDVYDVVILVDPNQEQLTASFCDQLAQHVVEGGCGLWWVCGEKFTLNALRPDATTRPLAELLPVVPDIDFAERKMLNLGLSFPRAWPYELAPDGADGVAAKVSRIVDDKSERRIVWSRLPGFHFWFPVKGLKPAATSVVESSNPDPKFRRDGRGMPMLAMQNVGAGRVLWLGTDESYRWRSIFMSAYERFWVNGIRYLFEGRIFAGNSRLRLTANAEKIDLGDAILISADVKDEALQPWIEESFEVVVEREGHESENVKLVPVESLPGSYEKQLRPTALGTYRVRPVRKIGKNTELTFQVVAAQIEREGPMDRAELAAIAAAPGGELFDTPAALLAALDQVPSRSATDTFRTPHALWDGWATIVFLIVVLSIEWILRKRFNLL